MALRIFLMKWNIQVSLKVGLSQKCEKWVDSISRIKNISLIYKKCVIVPVPDRGF